jgi:hypothetical protein
VHDHRVAVTDEVEHGPELRALHVFAGRTVGEGPVYGDAVQLPVDILVQAADPYVADPLSGNGVS